jgi:hypothetical protein
MKLTPLAALKKAVAILKDSPCNFCLIGGHAASLYRSQERFTRDVDFALVATDQKHSRAVAQSVIQALGEKPVLGFIPLNEEISGHGAVNMVTSQPLGDEVNGIIDILLPEIPWVSEAVERAQSNFIDLGFSMVPTITPEDLVIAKCYALKHSPDRFQDLDDLKQLFMDVKDLDTDYIRRRFERLQTRIPVALAKHVPESLQRFCS